MGRHAVRPRRRSGRGATWSVAPGRRPARGPGRTVKRLLVLAGAPGAVILLVGVAVAATITVTSNQLGAGTASVAQCEGTGTITTTFVPPGQANPDIVAGGTGYTLSSVTLTGVNNNTPAGSPAIGCGGKTVYVSVVDSSNAVLTSGSATIVAGTSTSATVQVTLAAAVQASQVGRVNVAIPN